MEVLRKNTLESYIKLGLNKDDAKILEEETYKILDITGSVSVSVSAVNQEYNKDSKDSNKDIDKYADKYIQTYIKVITNYNNAIKNGVPIKDIIKSSRETLNPEKWSLLTKERKNEGTVLDKKKGIHRCPKCKSWYTDYQQLQTASADESMRVSVVCLDCDWHWKYS